MEFKQVTAIAKANVYFDGKVVSHSIILEDGSKKTFGIIFPGTYHFDTEAAELMEITDGACKVQLAGESETKGYGTDSSFNIPANSGFDITVENGICQYVCSFLS